MKKKGTRMRPKTRAWRKARTSRNPAEGGEGEERAPRAGAGDPSPDVQQEEDREREEEGEGGRLRDDDDEQRVQDQRERDEDPRGLDGDPDPRGLPLDILREVEDLRDRVLHGPHVPPVHTPSTCL